MFVSPVERKNYMFSGEEPTTNKEIMDSPVAKVSKRVTDAPSIQTEQPKKEKKCFALAAGGGTRLLSTNKCDFMKYSEMMQINDNVVKIQPAEKLLLEEKRKTIIFKTYCFQKRKIEKITEEKIEKCLKPIWSDVVYLTRGKKFGTVEVRFTNKEIA
ncbi:uncharacterized protein LOC118765212 [Octopus sinensis]|uniref:Uncharacterized protein LOC118765212 n=1 Tax=Octopus sinensis TaxID=2607531 RepID=A0A7E6F794_9MOLL|nr:uncharacterized protein LOC118765212 [Octopus sinensis]